jgi:hypothetical protein
MDSLDGFTYGSYANNVQNFVRSYQKRVAMPVPPCNTNSMMYKTVKKLLKNVAFRIANKYEIKILKEHEFEEYINIHYTGFQRQAYLDAIKSFDLRPFDFFKDSLISSFIKDEIIPFKIKEIDEKPRMINARGPRWMVKIGLPMKDIEHTIYHCKKTFNTNDKNYEFAKCLNLPQRSELAALKIADLGNCVNVVLDGSSFDAHVNEEMLKLEGMFYATIMRLIGATTSELRLFKQAWKFQIRNRLRFIGPSGFAKATVIGNRMSGDWNTSLGNSVLMLSFVTAAMKLMQVPQNQYRSLNDGDDNCLWMTYNNLTSNFKTRLSALFLDIGQEVKVDINIELYKTRFCQNLFMFVNDWTFVRDYRRFLLKYTKLLKFKVISLSVLAHLKTMAYADIILFGVLPVMYPFQVKLYNAIDLQITKKDIDNLRRSGEYKYRDLSFDCPHGELQETEVPIEVRIAYQMSSGLTLSEQMIIEAMLISDLGVMLKELRS